MFCVCLFDLVLDKKCVCVWLVYACWFSFWVYVGVVLLALAHMWRYVCKYVGLCVYILFFCICWFVFVCSICMLVFIFLCSTADIRFLCVNISVLPTFLV